ncbi:MAG: hypothetical protein F4X91_09475 [Nitrospinae bacterium]|nr:hypothetical protein [Nitrospinota bacterium]
MASEHVNYHFSITFKTKDRAVVGCLRALAQYCQKEGNNRIPWGGTKDKDWRRDGYSVTFRFTKSSYRDDLESQAVRLFPMDLWSIVGKKDDDPASPQS